MGIVAHFHHVAWPAMIAGLTFVSAFPTGTANAQSTVIKPVVTDRQNESDQEPPILRVGIKVAVPFAMQNEDGTWAGISIELWRAVAERLGCRYEFQELPLDELFSKLESDDIDVSIAALTVTAEREKRIDFSHSYFNTGLGIAVVPKRYTGWAAVMDRFFSKVFLEIVAGIVAMLVVTGTLVYLFERKHNANEFGNGAVNGVANGIWWAAVTMTTVGYGDRVPKTIGGRTTALIWMFSAILIIASLTASVTSTLTVSRLVTPISSPRHLHDVRVATVLDSTSAQFLARERISCFRYSTIEACMEKLREEEMDAVVYDVAMLKYLCLNQFVDEIDVLPATFEKQDYAIALPQASKLREPINQALLEELGDPDWLEIVQRYLGNQGN
jgi:ABC-type amino acid transport substrate-binding protein